MYTLTSPTTLPATAADGAPVFFTVITVCFNARDTIQKCMDSVASQLDGPAPFDDFEYLVIDGVSTDGTVDIVRERIALFGGRATLVSEPDDGIYDAMNKGLARARGHYVMFVNADDYLAPGALAAMQEAAFDHQASHGRLPDCIAGALHVVGAGMPERIDRPERAQLDRRRPTRMPVGHQALAMDGPLLREIGCFSDRFPIAADYDAFLKMSEHGARWAVTDKVVATFTLGGASFGILRTATEYFRVRRANGFPRWMAVGLLVKNVLGSVYWRAASSAAARTSRSMT